jgi:putative DNA primase/helicase
MEVARVFLNEGCTVDGMLTLRHWRGGWWMWRITHWTEVDDRAVRSILYQYLEHAVYMTLAGPMAWTPNQHKIRNVIDALAAICFLRTDLDQPCWLEDGHYDDALVALGNGLLEVGRKRLLPHTPAFFNQTSVPFNYEPNAPEPTKWLQFLSELWPDEPDSITVLAQWFGYVISGRTDLHKILLMVGPTRGGKGAIARVLTALVGRQNTCGPTLNSLGGEFGLAPLIGKPLAIISDARFAGKDSSIVVERLLSISGEDRLTVNRKYRDQWTGKLPSRLHIISNELPKLGDASTAIVGRIVLLPLNQSWLGRENHDLEPALHTELPGILNFALAGLHSLTVNGNRFSYLPSAEEAVTTMRDLASPVGAFVRERCRVGPREEIAVELLYQAYKLWAEDNGHPKLAKSTFGRDLRAAVLSVKVTRPREHKRATIYVGINLNSETEDNDRGDDPETQDNTDPETQDDNQKGLCAQCNGREADAPLVTGKGYPPAGVCLHEQCRPFWLRRYRVK